MSPLGPLDVTMTKLFSAMAFTGLMVLAMGFYVNAATLRARLTGPEASMEQARCQMREVVVDEGYGVTQTQMREVCGRISSTAQPLP